MFEHIVTRHVARVHDVVEDDEPALICLARAREETEIRSERIRCGVVADRAVTVDLQLRGRHGAGEAVERTVRIIRAILGIRTGCGSQQKQRCTQSQHYPATGMHGSWVNQGHCLSLTIRIR